MGFSDPRRRDGPARLSRCPSDRVVPRVEYSGEKRLRMSIFRQEYRNPDPRSSQGLVSGRNFCSHHGIPHEESKTYPARLEDGLLVIYVVGE